MFCKKYMTEESLWITNRFGEKLEALIRKPAGGGPFSAVVFVSGISMDLPTKFQINLSRMGS